MCLGVSVSALGQCVWGGGRSEVFVSVRKVVVCFEGCSVF